MAKSDVEDIMYFPPEAIILQDVILPISKPSSKITTEKESTLHFNILPITNILFPIKNKISEKLFNCYSQIIYKAFGINIFGASQNFKDIQIEICSLLIEIKEIQKAAEEFEKSAIFIDEENNENIPQASQRSLHPKGKTVASVMKRAAAFLGITGVITPKAPADTQDSHVETQTVTVTDSFAGTIIQASNADYKGKSPQTQGI